MSFLLNFIFFNPYINLYTPQEFLEGDSVKVEITTEDVEEVLLRLYEVKDPYKFFKKQKNPDNVEPVGIAKKRKNFFIMVKSLAEDAGRYTRYIAREVLSKEIRQDFRDFLGIKTMEERVKIKKYSIPPLKKYKLLKEWKYYPSDTYYTWEMLDIGVLKKGVYLLEASYGYRVCYIPIIVTEAGLIAKRTPTQIFLYATKIKNSQTPKGKVCIKDEEGNKIAEGYLSKKGFFKIKADTIDMFAFAQTDAGFSLVKIPYYGTGYKKYSLYLYTERPVYRPDQMVYFKGIARLKKQGYRVVKNKRVNVKIENSEGNVIYERTLTTNDFGSFADSCYIPSNSPLGYYTVVAQIDECVYYMDFRVEEYRKPEFWVKIKTDKDTLLSNDKIKIKVDAEYFFGEPVISASIEINIHRAEWKEYWAYGRELYATVEDEFNKQYQYEITLPAKDADYIYYIEAIVRDKSGFEEKAEKRVMVYHGRVKPIINTSSYLYKTDEEISLQIRLKDLLQKKCVSGYVTVMLEKWGEELIWEKEIHVPSKGKLYRFKVEDPGSYKITVYAEDKDGNIWEEECWIWVTAYEGFAGYRFEDIKVITNKDEYKPGEDIEIMVVTPPGLKQVLFTQEKEGILDAKVIKIRNGACKIKLKAFKKYIPGFYVAFTGYTEDGKYIDKKRAIKINPDERILNIKIMCDKKIYKPGEKAKVKIEVKDKKGNPVKAELSIAVVDQAIFAIAPKVVSSPQEFFYSLQPSCIYNFYSLNTCFSAYEREYALTTAENELVAAYKGESEKMMIRKVFKDVAYWNPFILTDRNGTAVIEFKYPDNLTSWITDVIAVTQNTLVGEVREKTTIKKDIILRFSMPRFLTEKDSVMLKGIVHNYLSTRKNVSLKIEYYSEGIKKDTFFNISIPAHGIKMVEFPVVVKNTDRFVIKGYAKTDEEYDAVELSCPVLYHGVEKESTITEFFYNEFKKVKKIVIPENSHHARIDIYLSPTCLSHITEGIKALVGYPYGCVEQTMSSFLPDLIARDLLGKDVSGIKGIDKMIEKGVAKLIGYQHYDGGWGWWKDDETHPYMTAYALYGLFYAKKLGFRVPKNVIEKAKRSLLLQLNNTNSLQEISFMAYVGAIVGIPKDTVLSRLVPILKEVNNFDPYSLSYLAMFFDFVGDGKNAKKYLKILEEKAHRTPNYCFWRAKTPLSWWKRDVEVTAVALRAFLKTSPESKLVDKILLYLLKRKSGDAWMTTQETALSVLAIAEYLKIKGDEKVNASVTIVVNGKKVRFVRLKQNSSTEKIVIKDLKPINKIEVIKKGKGRILCSIKTCYYSTEEPIKGYGKELTIKRRYYRLIPGEEGYRKIKMNGYFEEGEPILVETEVIPLEDLEYVVVEDFIPSGCEVSKETYIVEGRRFYNPWWDVYDNRVAFFIFYLDRPITLHYILKPFVKGKFHTMPVRAYPMYFPEVKAISDEAIIEVR